MRFRKGIASALSATACAGFAADIPVTLAPPVVVTATRFEEPQHNLPVGVTVVTAEDIRRSTASSLAELLSQFAGVLVRDNTGGPDGQIDMRGFGITGDQNTLVLLNGQRLSEIELISPGLSAIPLNAVERIEIMRGSGAVLYGGGATGGTINIITRTPRAGEKSVLLFGGGGSYGTGEVRGTLAVASERAGIAVSASQFESDNYRDNNHSRQRNAETDLRFGDATRYFNIKLGGDEQDLRNPGVRTAAQLVTDRRGATTPSDSSSRSGSRMNLGAGWRFGASDVAVNLTYRDREARSIQSFFGAVTNLTTRVDTWALSPRLRMPFTVGGWSNTLVVGGDLDQWDYDSLFLGGFFNSHALAIQRNRAAYVQDNLQLTDDLRLLAGARLQRSENSITELLPVPATVEKSHSPRAYELALRYRLDRGTALFGKIGRSFRIATVDENRFQPTLLEPQTSRDREVGLDFETGRLRLRAAIFQMRLDNEIYFSPLIGAFGANINLSPTRRQGLELDTQWTPTKSLSLFANLALIEAEFRSGVYGGIDVSGNEVPLVPKRTLSVGGSWRFVERTDLSVLARHVGPQRFDNDQANTFMTMPTYITFDVKLNHQAGGWLFAATIRNLTNEKYFSYGVRNAAGGGFNAYPAAERSVFVSGQHRFQ
jgi:iron complex outermembrane receptor protein